jgi:hypothetical protein
MSSMPVTLIEPSFSALLARSRRRETVSYLSAISDLVSGCQAHQLRPTGLLVKGNAFVQFRHRTTCHDASRSPDGHGGQASACGKQVKEKVPPALDQLAMYGYHIADERNDVSASVNAAVKGLLVFSFQGLGRIFAQRSYKVRTVERKSSLVDVELYEVPMKCDEALCGIDQIVHIRRS